MMGNFDSRTSENLLNHLCNCTTVSDTSTQLSLFSFFLQSIIPVVLCFLIALSVSYDPSPYLLSVLVLCKKKKKIFMFNLVLVSSTYITWCKHWVGCETNFSNQDKTFLLLRNRMQSKRFTTGKWGKSCVSWVMRYNGFTLWNTVIYVQEILLCGGTRWPFRMGINNIPIFSRGEETVAQKR